MPRIKRGVMAHKRHKKIIKAAEGYFGARKNVFQIANEAVAKAGNYAYRDRRNKKRDFRRLWITRISAACRNAGTTYSAFIAAMIKHGIELDRKVLADLAVRDGDGFLNLLKQVGLVA
ncbi:MAG: 50S ribosomal protein L20 [Armatimonadota bacterium]|jgi:large subunit ribosomal protein L20